MSQKQGSQNGEPTAELWAIVVRLIVTTKRIIVCSLIHTSYVTMAAWDAEDNHVPAKKEK
jgi:hypothetical protein